jgi:hypothetical protein
MYGWNTHIGLKITFLRCIGKVSRNLENFCEVFINASFGMLKNALSAQTQTQSLFQPHHLRQTQQAWHFREFDNLQQQPKPLPHKAYSLPLDTATVFVV